MSKYEQRDNSGALFKNEGDRKRPNGPDYSGTCMVNGVEMFFDGWLKTSESGREWMSFSFKPKEQRQSKPQGKPRAQRDDFDDAPF